MSRYAGAAICVLIVVIDIVAGILGIQAEIAQNKEKHVRLLVFECKVPSHEAYKLGISAAALLAVSHAVANLLGGCICICSKEELDRSSTSKQWAAATLILSWVVAGVGLTLLIVEARANSKSRASCGLGHHHFLSVGGILCFVHGLICAAFYASVTAFRREEDMATRRKDHHPHSSQSV